MDTHFEVNLYFRGTLVETLEVFDRQWEAFNYIMEAFDPKEENFEMYVEEVTRDAENRTVSTYVPN